MNTVYVVVMLSSLVGPPPTSAYTLELLVNPYQQESKVLLGDLKRNDEDVALIRAYYNIKITDINTKSYLKKTPCWRVNKGDWKQWQAHVNFPDGPFKTAGFAFRTIKYDLLRLIYDDLYSGHDSITNPMGIELALQTPFPLRCQNFKVKNSDEAPQELLEKLKEFKFCIYYYSEEQGNFLAVDNEHFTRIYNVVDDKLSLTWSGVVTHQSFANAYVDGPETRMHMMFGRMFRSRNIQSIVREDILEKYWSVMPEPLGEEFKGLEISPPMPVPIPVK